MPYVLRKAPKRELYWVVAKDGSHKSIEPLPLERAKAQMRALYAREFGYPPLRKSGGAKGRTASEEELRNIFQAYREGRKYPPSPPRSPPPRTPPTKPKRKSPPKQKEIYKKAKEGQGGAEVEQEEVPILEVSKSAPSFPIGIPEVEPYISQQDVKDVEYSGGSYYPEQNRTQPVRIRKPTGYKSPAICRLAERRAVEKSMLDEDTRRRLGLITRGHLV